MTELEQTRHEEMLANINKMVADVDMDHKKYTLEIVRLVMYGVIAGSALTLAIIKVLG